MNPSLQIVFSDLGGGVWGGVVGLGLYGPGPGLGLPGCPPSSCWERGCITDTFTIKMFGKSNT